MNIVVKQTIPSQKKITSEEIINLVLKQRDIPDIAVFLSPPSPLDFSLKDFGFTKKDISQTMTLLKKLHKNQKTVVVYTDYDADGITGGSVLWETLHLLGFNAMPYVPHRKHEGYGFSKIGIDRVKKEFDPGLIISVDHGITAVDQVSYAKTLGIPVIITDHHHKQEMIPEDAVSIFHIPALSGSGTAYIVAKEIFEYFKSQSLITPPQIKKLEMLFQTDYLALATIGTVADLVPLVGPSRSIVAAGLAAFPRVKRHGIRELCKEAAIDGKVISPYEIGFQIAPRINAVGRLEHGLDALRLLCTTDEARAAELAKHIGMLNIDRQELVKKQVAEARAMVEVLPDIPPIIILHAPHWHEGVIGLIAAQILELYYRPTIIMTQGDGFYKASVRSIPGFHITDFLTMISKHFHGFGGHAAAAGFTLPLKNLARFEKDALKRAGAQLTPDKLVRTFTADLGIPASFLSKKLSHALESLSPFGMGNPAPTFFSEVEVLHAARIGKEKTHLKLSVREAGSSMLPLEGIAFGQAEIFPKLSKLVSIQMVYKLGINTWNSKETLQAVIKQIALTDDVQ